MSTEIDREKFLDPRGIPQAVSLFLEVNYSPSAIFTLKEDDYEYDGKVLISLKKRYLEMADPTEYDFANKWLLGWKHWNKVCKNPVLIKHIEEWREELEIKIRSDAVKHMLVAAKSGNYQAAKWFADKGWTGRPAGRPSKAEVDGERKVMARLKDDYDSDIIRLFPDKVQNG